MASDSDPADTCWTVLRAAAGGDAGARSTFARSYAGPIRACLQHRWRGRALLLEIEDAVQEAFVESLKPGGALDSADPQRGDFRSLLYGVVRNIARRFEERAAKANARSSGQSVFLDDLPHQAAALSRVFDRAWARSLLREAVLHHQQESEQGGTDARRRFRVMRMRHDDGLAIREIAMALDVPDVAIIHNDYRQARRAFASHLRQVVGRHTGTEGAAVDRECRRLTELLGS
jgi:hypothetical protein